MNEGNPKLRQWKHIVACAHILHFHCSNALLLLPSTLPAFVVRLSRHQILERHGTSMRCHGKRSPPLKRFEKVRPPLRAAVLAIGTANPTNCVPQDEYVDCWYFRVTKSDHLTELKAKMKRICTILMLCYPSRRRYEILERFNVAQQFRRNDRLQVGNQAALLQPHGGHDPGPP
jgi:hypothetical protein